ncbi:MAG: S24/S26 family peptidase [Sphingomonadaceae bacterium]
MADQAVRERLDALIRESGQGYAALSRLLGRNPAYIQQYIKRGVPRSLGESERTRLAQHFGVPEHFLGAPARMDGGVPEPSGKSVAIPWLDPDNGSLPRAPRTSLAFDHATAMRLCAGHIDRLGALIVDSDAMFPTLSTGDRIIIEMDQRRGLKDGIYVIRADNVLLVKRLSVHPITGRVAILSDNAAYPSFSDCDPELIAVVGRVRWIGRQL